MLARKSLLIFLANGVGAACGMISLLFIGRFMGPSTLGMVGFAFAFVGLFTVLNQLGYGKAHVKRISEGFPVALCLGTFVRIKLLLLTLFLVVTVSVVVGREITVGYIAATSFPVVLVFVAYWTLEALRRIPETTFNALRLTASVQLMNILENLVRMPLIVGVALLFGYLKGRWVPLRSLPERLASLIGLTEPLTEATGGLLLAAAYAVAMALSLLIGLWLMRRHGLVIGQYDRSLAKAYTAFAIPVAGYMAFQTMAHHLDNVMLGYFWTSTEVGHYFAAQRFATLVVVVPAAVQTLFFPFINELLAKREFGAVKEVAVTTQRLMSLVLIAILMLTLVYASEVMRIFVSAAFLPAAPALRLLVATAALTLFTTVGVNILLGIERQWIVAAISSAGVILNMTLNVIFIPESVLGVPLLGLKSTGAALATFLAKVITTLVVLVVLWRVTRTTYLSWSLPKHLFAAGVTGVLLQGAAHLWEFARVERVWELAGAGVVGILIYCGILFLLRELTRKDVLFLVDMFHPGQMAGYIRDELRGKRRD